MTRTAHTPPARAPGRHAIEIDGVVKAYGSKVAVDCPALTVRPGEFLTLLGPSGSGKTTLLMIVAGFVEPDRGRVMVDGRDISRLPPEKRNFGMVFQGYALFPHMTVAENVAFPLKLRGISRAEVARRVAANLARVRLADLGGRLPRQLSGGQQQRVALARSLSFEPDLLLLDEPLSALDRALRGEMQLEFKMLHREIGMTFLCVTHDQDEALSMSDRIAVMRDGRIVQVGTPRELYERPASRFVAGFLGTSNFLEGPVVARGGGRISFESGGQVLAQACDAEVPVGRHVTVAIRPEKIRLGAPDASHPNTLPGRIVASSYLGSGVLATIDTPAGTIMVQRHLDRTDEVPRTGDAVTLSWDPSASMLVETTA